MTGSRPRGNHHPTVKPARLMSWLVRLVTPPDGVVLDPFMGSGSTLLGAHLSGVPGVRCVGIEMSPEYCEIIRARWGAREEVRAIMEGLDRSEAAVESRACQLSLIPVEG